MCKHPESSYELEITFVLAEPGCWAGLSCSKRPCMIKSGRDLLVLHV